MPKKPEGCNRNHNPKALEHPTGLPNPQPSHKLPVPSPPQAPVTLELDSSVEREFIGGGGIGREQREPQNDKQLTHKCHANRVLNRLQAHGRQRVNKPRMPLDSISPRTHTAMTAANAMKHTNTKQTLIHGQDTGQRLQERP